VNRARNIEFERLVSHFADRIYNHALRMLGAREDAEEAVQDIFLKVYRGINGFRGTAELRSWLYRITVNTCLTRMRTRRAREVHPDAETDADGSMWDTVASQDTDPAEQLIEKDLNDFIMRALDTLSPHEREILVLYHVDGLSYGEISRTLDIPVGTACNRMFRARTHLREAMKTVEEELRG
jgi:RNA polymerase sigma-70 factor (ECF subfamily)